MKQWPIFGVVILALSSIPHATFAQTRSLCVEQNIWQKYMITGTRDSYIKCLGETTCGYVVRLDDYEVFSLVRVGEPVFTVITTAYSRATADELIPGGYTSVCGHPPYPE